MVKRSKSADIITESDPQISVLIRKNQIAAMLHRLKSTLNSINLSFDCLVALELVVGFRRLPDS